MACTSRKAHCRLHQWQSSCTWHRFGFPTPESKEAVEPYPEIVKEIKLGLQQCARKLAQHLNRETLLYQEHGRRSYIERYLPHIGIALQEILGLSNEDRDATVTKLDHALLKSRTPVGQKS
jgi:DNA topoisomerase-6 subunit B